MLNGAARILGVRGTRCHGRGMFMRRLARRTAI